MTGDLFAVARPHVLDEAGVARDGGVGVDLLAVDEGVFGALAADDRVIDDAAPQVQRNALAGEPLAREGAGGHDEFESAHARSRLHRPCRLVEAVRAAIRLNSAANAGLGASESMF